MTILDLIKISNKNGFDIADDIWDCGNYFECCASLKDCGDDAYDKVNYIFGKHLEVIKFQPDWYTICNISGFIEKNIKMFNEFLTIVYKEEYRPAVYMAEYASDDEEWFYYYIDEMFFSLVNGSFSDQDYETLYRLMEKYGLTKED